MVVLILVTPFSLYGDDKNWCLVLLHKNLSILSIEILVLKLKSDSGGITFAIFPHLKSYQNTLLLVTHPKT